MDELWLERMAEVLCCDKDPAAVVVALNELQEQLASAKRMVAKLRGQGDCGLLVNPDLKLFGKPVSELDEMWRGVIIQPEDKFLSINGVGEVAIPDGAGVLPVTSSLGISGTLDIKENKELGVRKLVGYKFNQPASKLSVTIPERVALVAISPCDTEISFSGAGVVKIPDGVGVFEVTTHLGFKGTIEIRNSEISNGKRRLAGFQFACSSKMPSKPMTERQIIEALESNDLVDRGE